MTPNLPEPLAWTQGWADPISGFRLEGETEDCERFILMPYSHVRVWAQPSRPLTKHELEIWHLGQYCQDCWAATGTNPMPYGFIRSERPDFLIPRSQVGGDVYGLELTAFTPEARRRIEARVGPLREAVAQEPQRCSRLAGCAIWITPVAGANASDAVFGALQDPGPVLSALDRLIRPRSHRPEEFADGMPDVFPEGLFTSEPVSKEVNLVCQEIVPLELAEHDPIWRVPRIDPQFQIDTTLQELRQDLARIFNGHNYERLDHLVIVAGGPDRFGRGYFEDEGLLRAVVEQTEDFGSLISSRDSDVFIHYWSNGQIERLRPHREIISSGMNEAQRRQVLMEYRNEHQAWICFTAPIAVTFEVPAT